MDNRNHKWREARRLTVHWQSTEDTPTGDRFIHLERCSLNFLKDSMAHALSVYFWRHLKHLRRPTELY